MRQCDEESAERQAGGATLRIAVLCLEPEVEQQAAALALRLGAPLVRGETSAADCDLLLEVSSDGLAARVLREPRLGTVRLDFVGGALGHRLRQGVGRSLPLARAVGVTSAAARGRAKRLRVFDATLGLGRDAFLLAAVGCAVNACERSAVLLELVRDALARARAAPALREAVERLSLCCGDALEVLAESSSIDRPDVVYLDPMFPERRRESALVKKQMRLVHLLAGRHDPKQDQALFAAALASGAPRIVVKRFGNAPALAPGVHHTIAGKSVRYDVYQQATG